VTHRDLIVGETLATQFASAGPEHRLPDGLPGSPTQVVVGDNHAATILVVKR
jgi:isoleucyl-tRNA synthetase